MKIEKRKFHFFLILDLAPYFFEFFEILLRATDRTEKQIRPVRFFRIKIRTAYRTRFESGQRTRKMLIENPDHRPDQESGPRTKIRTKIRSGFSVRSGRPWSKVLSRNFPFSYSISWEHFVLNLYIHAIPKTMSSLRLQWSFWKYSLIHWTWNPFKNWDCTCYI